MAGPARKGLITPEPVELKVWPLQVNMDPPDTVRLTPTAVGRSSKVAAMTPIRKQPQAVSPR
ncbi:unnamed protein product, partial [Nesidiocoris tenuis]